MKDTLTPPTFRRETFVVLQHQTRRTPPDRPGRANQIYPDYIVPN